MSNFLHDSVLEGDVLDVFPPTGEFTLQDGACPLVLISGGVGITPTLAMAEAALAKGGREVAFLHYARNGDVHAFSQTLEDWAANHPQFQSFIVYEQGEPGEDSKADAFGRPVVDHLERWVPASRDCDVYFLGPKPFMAFVKRSLAALGLPTSRMHYEFFGPAEALN